MAKKKKEVCPYCGKSFAYLSRHKCKIKERVEGDTKDKTVSERRIERVEEKRKETHRNLKKDEKTVLEIVNRRRDLYFDELKTILDITHNELEKILDVLSLQSKIKVKRELLDSSWTKRISAIIDYSKDVNVSALKIDKKRKDFIWNLFSRQPCFICIFQEKCNETNLDALNPNHCPWLNEWIELTLEGKEYTINFDDIKDTFQD